MSLKEKQIGRTTKAPETKECRTCLRLFENRKRWSSRSVWEQVLYCSKTCQRMKDNISYKEKFKKDVKK